MDDDIAAALPPPPPAAPARRAAAIELALRRFDGVDDLDPVRPQPRSERPAPWWTRLGLPQAGAFVSIALVALIGLPVAWISLDRPSGSGGAIRGPAVSERAPGTEKMAELRPADTAPDASAPARATDSAAPSPDAPALVAEPAAPVELAKTDALPPPAAAPAPAPPPPPAMAAFAEKAETPPASRVEAPAELAARAPQGIVVTGSRVRSSSQATASPAAAAKRADAEEMADSSIVVTGTRTAFGVSRGDWNACTVDDPARSLRGCRRAIGTGAAAQVSDGLALAWKGELDAAITAFDSAIAIAPRSASAYLNRGLVYRRQGQIDRALADFDHAVRYAPNAARGYYQRSLAHRAQGQARRASADEDRAVDLDPDYATLLNRR